MNDRERWDMLFALRQEINRIEAEIEELHSMDVICKNKDCQHPFCPEHSLESN